MAAISPEVDEMSTKLRKFAKYFLKVYPFASAQKNQGVAVKVDMEIPIPQNKFIYN